MVDKGQQLSAAVAADSPADLPDDELRAYARQLGVDIRSDEPRGGVLRQVRERRQLLNSLDRAALLDIVVWLRRPVKQSASKESLASAIGFDWPDSYDGLSDRGLFAFSAIRGIETGPNRTREAVEKELHAQAGLRGVWRRTRRRVLGSLIGRLVDQSGDSGEAYQFLPEENGASLRRRIESSGVVGGIAKTLRGVADDYVTEKLDEIELRIDKKLDEIDKRLEEWRDRELSNRLKILKATLLLSIIVAVISLGYDALRSNDETRLRDDGQRTTITDGASE